MSELPPDDPLGKIQKPESPDSIDLANERLERGLQGIYTTAKLGWETANTAAASVPRKVIRFLGLSLVLLLIVTWPWFFGLSGWFSLLWSAGTLTTAWYGYRHLSS